MDDGITCSACATSRLGALINRYECQSPSVRHATPDADVQSRAQLSSSESEADVVKAVHGYHDISTIELCLQEEEKKNGLFLFFFV